MGSSVNSVVWRLSSSLLQQFRELGDGRLPSSVKTLKRQDLIFVIYLVCIGSLRLRLWGSFFFGITLLTKLAECLGRKAVGL